MTCQGTEAADAFISNGQLGHRLFAHTSPVYVDLAGKRAFDVDAALALVRQVEQGQAEIRARGTFTSPQARDAILALHDEAIQDLKKRISRRGQ